MPHLLWIQAAAPQPPADVIESSRQIAGIIRMG
jgi:hypothetical protein